MTILKISNGIVLISCITTLIQAGTLMDASIKTHNPYLADMDGFDSLFVNPAGVAGKTTAFNLYASAGAWGDDFESIEKLKNLAAKLGPLMNLEEEISEDDISEIIPTISEVVPQSTMDSIFKDSSLEGLSLEQAADPDTWDNWKYSNTVSDDIKKIQTNISDPDVQQNVLEGLKNISYNLEASVRLGTLIRGIGFGLYTNGYSLLSLGAEGIEELVTELGTLIGYGFKIGQFSFGIRGQYAMFFTEDPASTFSIIQSDFSGQSLMYGNAWGLDVGTIWEVKKGLRFALLLNDLIGNNIKITDLTAITLGKIMNLDIPTPNSNNEWGMDASFGMTWEQTRGDFRPGISIDFYDTLGFFKALDNSYTGLNQLYKEDTFLLSRHLRVGINVNIVDMFDFRTSYYMDRIAFEFGFNMKYFETYIAVNTLYDFSDFGGNLMLQFKL